MVDKHSANLAALAILSVTLIIIVFIQTTGFAAEKAVLSGITGIMGLVAGGGAGYILGKAKGGEQDEAVE